MKVEIHDNAATITIDLKESFYFKGSILTGYPAFEWCLLPPHPLGSPILRLFFKSYFGMRKVTAGSKEKIIPLTGYFPRGNFYKVIIPEGKKFFINARCLAGFSGDTHQITTHIKMHPVFWCLREHFFTVVTGPSTVLLYGKSRFELREDATFEAVRIMSFDIARRLTTTIPETKTSYSAIRNVFSNTVYLCFVDSGKTLVTVHHGDEKQEKLSIKECLLHILAFIKF